MGSVIHIDVFCSTGVCSGREMSKIQLGWSGWAEELDFCMLGHRKLCRPLDREAAVSDIFARFG